MREAYFLTREVPSKNSLMLDDGNLKDYEMAMRVWPAVREIMDREMDHAERISKINKINGASGGRQAVAERIEAKVKHSNSNSNINTNNNTSEKDMSPSQDKPAPVFPRIDPETKLRIQDEARKMCHAWPKVNPRGESLPRASQSLTRKILGELVAKGYTLDGLCRSAVEYLKDFKENKRSSLKAPQNYFGPRGPWEDHYAG